jgi:tRNA/rRNA methyltransferase
VSAAPPSLLPEVLLVRPQEAGNVGAVARAMANMGLARLHLVEPAAATDGDSARAFAMHAHHVLDGARRHPDLGAALAGFEVAVGTASLRERGWPQPVLTPRALPGWLARAAPGSPVALVFGPEVSGLTAEELARMSVLVSIPTAPAQPTLNLAQAVLVVAYELFLARGAPGALGPRPEPRATVAEIERLFGSLETLLAEVRFARDDTIHGVVRDLRQLLARAGATEREAAILAGILRRTRHALARAGARREGSGEPGPRRGG